MLVDSRQCGAKGEKRRELERFQGENNIEPTQGEKKQ
jgi:hypothetical protein